MRKQLENLAKCISDNQFVVPLDSFVALPFVPDNESISLDLKRLREEQTAHIISQKPIN